MKWFEENRFLGTFLTVLGVATVASLIFIWFAKSGFGEAKGQFEQKANEMAALQRHNPFPTEANLGKVKTQAADYAKELAALKEDLKTHVLAEPAEMKPNEFQARLREAMTSVTDKARANKVQLPEVFFLGFEEFGAALPDTEAAPKLGQELAQVELLVNMLIDARVQAITSLKRVKPVATPTPTLKAGGRAATPAAAAKQKLLEKPAIELAFTGTPGATRRALNQIATANDQLYVIRTLHILNEKDTGPPRVGAGAAPAAPAASPPPNTALNFIVGTELVQTAARIEMVRFTF